MPAKSPEVDQARRYIKRIKERFLNDPQKYKKFLEILHGYHKEQHSIERVYEEVKELFRDHADLLEEFKLFLPDSSSGYLQQQQQQQQHYQQQQYQYQQMLQLQQQQQQQIALQQQMAGQNVGTPHKKGPGRRKQGTAQTPRANMAIVMNPALGSVAGAVPGQYLQHYGVVQVNLPQGVPPGAVPILPAPTTAKRRRSAEGAAGAGTEPKRKRTAGAAGQSAGRGAEPFFVLTPERVAQLARTAPARTASQASFSGLFRQLGGLDAQEALFRKLRTAMDPLKYRDLLFCLELCGQGVLTEAEVLHAAHFILGLPETAALFAEFKRCVLAAQPDCSALDVFQVQGDGPHFFGDDGSFTTQARLALQPRHVPHAPASHAAAGTGTGVGTCTRTGCHYFQVPAGAPAPRCSGRTDADASVLNDTLVCCPVATPSASPGSAGSSGSADAGAQAPLPLEDAPADRGEAQVEFDVAIEQHRAVLRTLFRFLQAGSSSRGNNNKDENSNDSSDTTGKEPNPKTPTVDALTRSVVTQLYGARAPRVLALLATRPEAVAPVLIARVRQRTAEFLWWRRRTDAVLAGVLAARRDRTHAGTGSADPEAADARAPGAPDLSANALLSQVFEQAAAPPPPRPPPHAQLQQLQQAPPARMDDRAVHRDIFRLLAFRPHPADARTLAPARLLPARLRAPLQDLFRTFLLPFFGLSSAASAAASSASSSSAPARAPATLRPPLAVPSETLLLRPPPGPAVSSTVYGGAALALFFQLYRVLYEQLAAAKQLLGRSCAGCVPPPRPPPEVAPHTHYCASDALWLERFDQLCAGASVDLGCAEAAAARAPLYYRRFLCACAARRVGVLDAPGLAHELEALFGAQARTFAAAGRAADALARATTALLASPRCARLVRTFTSGAPSTALRAARASAQHIVGPDAQLFRIAYGADGLAIVPEEEEEEVPSLFDADGDIDSEDVDGFDAPSLPLQKEKEMEKEKEKQQQQQQQQQVQQQQQQQKEGHTNTLGIALKFADRREVLEFSGYGRFDAEVVGQLGRDGREDAAGPPALLRRSCVALATRAEQDRLAGTRTRLDCTLGLGEQVRTADQRLTFVSGTEDAMHWSSTTVDTGDAMHF